MVKAKRNFCKVAISLLISVALLLSMAGLKNVLKAFAAENDPPVEIDVGKVTCDTGNALAFKQSGTYQNESFDYVIQLLPEQKLTELLMSVWYDGTYTYDDITSDMVEVTSTNTDFIECSVSEKSKLAITTKDVADSETVIKIKVFNTDKSASETYGVYVSNKSPLEGAYEYIATKMDSMTMVGNMVSQVHGTLNDVVANVAAGKANNVQALKSEGFGFFFNNFLFNGLTLHQTPGEGYQLNVHVNGPGAPRDFAIYGNAVNFKNGDVVAFKKGLTLLSGGDGNANHTYLLKDNKPFIFEETQLYRYDGSKFVAVQGVKTVEFTTEQESETVPLTELLLKKGETATQTATVTKDPSAPADLDTTVTYASNNPEVVSVDENTGKVTALNAGVATITATTAVDGISGSYTVMVADPAIEPADAMIEGGKLGIVTTPYEFIDSVDDTYTTGYTVAAGGEGYDYEIRVNKSVHIGRPMELLVVYGNDTDEITLTNVSPYSGYRVADGDIETSSSDEDIIVWTGDAYKFTLELKDLGEADITLKAWLPASDTEYSAFGKVTAKDDSLCFGDIKIKVTVYEEDVTESFTFGGARRLKEGEEVLIDFADSLNIAKAAGDKWNNTENGTNKADLPEWYDYILINGYTRDQYLAKGFNVNMHIRSEYLDFFQYVAGTANPAPFQDGDVITIKKGFKLIEPAQGSTWQWYHAETQAYLVLAEQAMFRYDAEAKEWVNLMEVEDIKLWVNADATVAVDNMKVSLDVNGEVTLDTTVIVPEETKGVCNEAIKWAVTDSSVASLTENEDGTVTVKLLKDGSTTVTATAVAGGKQVTLTVEKKQATPSGDNTGDNKPGDSTGDNSGDNNTNTGDNSANTEAPAKKKKCGGSVAASASVAAIALLFAAGVVLISKKRKNA